MALGDENFLGGPFVSPAARVFVHPDFSGHRCEYGGSSWARGQPKAAALHIISSRHHLQSKILFSIEKLNYASMV